jgi:hypothetical protein
MEREVTGTIYMVANCEGSQSPLKAAELGNKKKKLYTYKTVKILKHIRTTTMLHVHVSAI